MVTEIEITPMKPEDAPAVAELTSQLGYPATYSEIQQRFDRIQFEAGHALLVARTSSGTPCGWIHLRPELSLETGSKLEVAALVIDEKLRGLGIGAKLMSAGENWAQKNGSRIVHLRSNVIRSDAHRFYERLGYQLKKTSHLFEKEL